jgi:hypothetical protein
MYPWRLYLQFTSSALDGPFSCPTVPDYEGVAVVAALTSMAADILINFSL